MGGLGESEGESWPRTELRSLAERQAQLTERRCGSRGRRVWGESQLGHQPPRSGLCPGCPALAPLTSTPKAAAL